VCVFNDNLKTDHQFFSPFLCPSNELWCLILTATFIIREKHVAMTVAKVSYEAVHAPSVHQNPFHGCRRFFFPALQNYINHSTLQIYPLTAILMLKCSLYGFTYQLVLSTFVLLFLWCFLNLKKKINHFIWKRYVIY